MISRLYRFHGYNSLRGVYKSGQQVRAAGVSLKFMPRPAGKPYRTAVVVSRKVSKSAVMRNRIRRRIYEAVRHQSGEFPASYDLVFTVFSDQLAAIPAAQLESTIIEILSRAQLIRRSRGDGHAIVNTEGNEK